MQYAPLGNSGLIVSRLAFGAMTFGQGHLAGDLHTRIGQEGAAAMVNRALDAGINFFDTADMYTSGESETILGRILKDRRTDVVIATKCGFRSGPALTSTGLSYRYVIQAAEGSLKRLGTDYIDLYILHIPDPITPLEETARALEELVARGHARYVGLSNYPAWQIQKLADLLEGGPAPLIAAQMYYSLLGRDIEHEVVPMIRAGGLGLICWSPLASGFLTGKYSLGAPEGSRRAVFDFPPIDVDLGHRVVKLLDEMARKRQSSISRCALAWLLSRDHVGSVLVGANSMEQLEDNLGAAGLCLEEAELAALDALTAPRPGYPAWMQPMGHDAEIIKALQSHRTDA